MKFRNYPLSLLPSQFLGRKSLIRYGLEAGASADTFWSAVLVLFRSATDCLIHFHSQLLYQL